MEKIEIRKKNNDGSYSTSPYLFDAVDLYNGDVVKSIIEISPIGNTVKNVKFTLSCLKDGIEYDLEPVNEDSYELVTDRYKGMSIWFADKNGIKFKPDKNGVVSITNTLAVPIDLQIWLRAEKYTVEKLNETIVLDDFNLKVWTQDAI